MATEHIKPKHEGLGGVVAVCLVILGLCMIVGVIIWMIVDSHNIMHSPGHASMVIFPEAAIAAVAGLL